MIHCFGRAALGNPDGPLTREQFVSLVFTPLDEKAVDAVLFSFGSGNVAEYESNVLEWPGEADQFHFPKARTWHGGVEVDPADQYRNPKAMAEAGANPPAVIVDECHPFCCVCDVDQYPFDVPFLNIILSYVGRVLRASRFYHPHGLLRCAPLVDLASVFI